MDDCICKTCVRKDCPDRMQFGDLRVLLYCADYLGHKITNADRIRAMSDEELANFITDNQKGWCTEIGREMYYQHNMEWLKQPVEDE